jgi:hypothetical protein
MTREGYNNMHLKIAAVWGALCLDLQYRRLGLAPAYETAEVKFLINLYRKLAFFSDG